MLCSRFSLRGGFTLVELATVVAILAVIAVFVVPRIAGFAIEARETSAKKQMADICEAFVAPDSGYISDMGHIPGFSRSYLRIANLLISTNLFGEVIDGSDRMRGFRVDEENGRVKGLAKPSEFVRWNDEARRGWRGPYLKNASGVFPGPDYRRFSDDATAAERGFFPQVSGLRLPFEFNSGDVSVYGFPGEPAITDPWGNPYVLQIPPAQAFSPMSATNVSDTVRFRYARVVSAGPDGVLSTPCYTVNATNDWREVGINWLDARQRRLSRQAGLVDGADRSLRGDDIVLFLSRNDVDEGETEP
jgi:prepilin-type N-terminal cleavage/methylation domain-containing protein